MPQTEAQTILHENKAYWTGRAGGYSAFNQTELSTAQRPKWKRHLAREVRAHFARDSFTDLSVLDIGCGPGFFSILLAELGAHVTAIDLTAAMLKEAKRNAGALASRITFLEMNAEQLSFADNTFDAVISRNLTWNLPHPKKAYQEWCRVLHPGGLLLNYDSNWYHYLFDETARAGYEQDRRNTAESGIRDENIGESFDVMEEIALRVPLSQINRPAWDMELLASLGLSPVSDIHLWKELWSPEEIVNFSSTPMFQIKATKGDSQ